MTWCYIHNKLERLKPFYYRHCMECGHTYRTRWSLLRAHNYVIKDMGDRRRFKLGNLRFFCGLCLHDF